MSLTVIALIAVVLVVIALGAMVTGIFNTLVYYRNRYKNAFAQIPHPRVRRQILHGAVTCITADRTVTATEAELLRAIAASLDCPMPSLLL